MQISLKNNQLNELWILDFLKLNKQLKKLILKVEKEIDRKF